MSNMNHLLVGRPLLTRAVRLTECSKGSTLNGEARVSALASTLKGRRFFGTSTGSIPVKSVTNVNLEPLLTEKNLQDSLRKLKRKRFKKDISDVRRYSDTEERKLNSFGDYLAKTRATDFYKKELHSFSFDPYLGLKIEKANGKPRPLLIPSSKDRVVLQAVFPKVQTTLKSALMKQNALGLGYGRGNEINECNRVLINIQNLLNKNEAEFVLKLDFKDFFSSIDRITLLKKLSKEFKGKDNRRLFRLVKDSIENSIDASPDFHGTFGSLKLRTTGVPQGLSYSPLLASFYALPLDRLVTRVKNVHSYRYLDDMIVLTRTEDKAKEIYQQIVNLSQELKLKLHPLEKNSKTQLININSENFQFLGIGVSKNKVFIPRDAIDSFKATFEREILNTKIVGIYSFETVFKAFKEYAQGWTNYYRSICPRDFIEVEIEINEYLDKYIGKHRTRNSVGKFFGKKRLIISDPFLRTKT